MSRSKKFPGEPQHRYVAALSKFHGGHTCASRRLSGRESCETSTLFKVVSPGGEVTSTLCQVETVFFPGGGLDPVFSLADQRVDRRKKFECFSLQAGHLALRQTPLPDLPNSQPFPFSASCKSMSEPYESRSVAM